MEIKKEELPNFFVIHPYSDQVVPYPEELSEPDDFSPELILLWARRTVLYLEIELFEQDIKLYNAKVLKGEEEVFEWETQKIEQAKVSLKAAEEEKAIVMEKLEETTQMVNDAKKEKADKTQEPEKTEQATSEDSAKVEEL